MYALGIDLGTTFTSAAVWRNGRAEVISLGSHSAAIPSVVLLRQDETFLTGEAANRRGFAEPHRVAREFKRRLGDTTPILLGGVPQSAEALMARVLRWTVDEVVRREGGQPTGICLSHPANWGPYKMDLLRQAVRIANLDQPVMYTSEPEAAAVNYAQQQRIEPGAVVAVYDLGGGTFDAAVLRKTANGFAIIGQPEGIERLGGIDFDAAVFNHVRAALGGKLEELDEDDPAVIAAVARLRDECVQAKEALSSDTDTAISVMLPNVATEIRLTRAEFEAMIRPALHGSIEALHRAVRSAGCTPEMLHSVLLVGGSSRMPIVSQLVGSELGRPVAVDTHPKHAVSLGAAWLASGQAVTSGAGAHPAAPVSPAMPVPPSPSMPPPNAPATGAYRVPPTATVPQQTYPAPTAPVTRNMGAESVPTAPGAGVRGVVPVRGNARTESFTSTGDVAMSAAGAGPSAAGAAGKPPAKRRGTLLVAGVALLALLLGGGGLAWALTSGGDDGDGQQENTAVDSGVDPGNQVEGGGTEPDDDGETGSDLPADEQCTDQIKSNPRWVCITSATVSGGRLTIEYDANFGQSGPNINGGYHLHIYGSNGTNPPDRIMGVHVPPSEQGVWYVEDQQPSVIWTDDDSFVQVIGDWPKVCARIATHEHELVQDSYGAYATGNCAPISWQ
ncbi:Hsp70 family protein [Solwaraspora sp. WMMB335]|uniref:Hsp70 family protein n=1 Tax=Solwaraspora sp. WMMB335 TaxID=3404118 RepID=UPI003B92EE3E